MRRFIFSVCVCTPLLLFPSNASPFGEGLDIQLQEAVYGDGIVSTEKGGIIRGKDFFLQARLLQYVRTGEGSSSINKIIAQDQLFVQYKGSYYSGSKAELDLTTGTLLVWNGCTKVSSWFIGGDLIEIAPNGQGTITNAYVTTSENEHSDWSVRAKQATITKDSQIRARHATFNFMNVPFFWVPSFSSELFKDIRAPVRVRFKYGGAGGSRIGLSYLINAGQWKHRLLGDYSFKYGYGLGVRSQYIEKDGNGSFDCLNYLAQGRSRDWDFSRFRLQGLYKNYFSQDDIHCIAMYDKLSDKGMKTDFADHPVADARAGLTQGSLWKADPNWLARLNSRIRINSFQTVKQELPLFTFNTRPQTLGATPCIIDNRFKTGYLSYVYANNSKSVHDFASSRTEISQKIFSTFATRPITLTPSIGYHLLHYSNSPQHRERIQAIGEMSLEAKSRFVKSSASTPQVAEPYAVFSSITSPLVQPNHTYIFDMEDGWSRVNELRYGIKNYWWFSPQEDARRKLFLDIYTRSFFSTKNLQEKPNKLWMNSTWDATPTLAFKLTSAWDFLHSRFDHINVAAKKTFSEKFAIILENRNRSPYFWRKIDTENYIVDAVRPTNSLLHSEMSDSRNTFITRFFWAVNPAFDIDLSVYRGWRQKKPREYYNYELNIGTLVRGALKVSLTVLARPGKPPSWWISCELGLKKESDSIGFKKIGQGNYDVW